MRSLGRVTPPSPDPAPYPGAVAPERQYRVDVGGLGIAIHEWGDAGAPPLMLAHGGFDFARTFETFAPLLAEAGWRVVAWDQRGHGDSDRAHLYSWDADLRDASTVFDHIVGREAVPVVGHSKGGALTINLADAEPFRFRALVNIDGIPSKRPTPDVAEHERTKMLISELTGWLDHRRRTATASRRPGTIDELAERRRKMNPRLPIEWLRHLVTIGATETEDGWRWNVDPSLRFGGFGPWRPEWALTRLAGLAAPFYGLLAGLEEPMGWGTDPDDVRPFLPMDARLDILDGIGHFAHIEQPREIASRVTDFLGEPS
jgi:pimeloyl-ACP methyl ester carboxylesterase